MHQEPSVHSPAVRRFRDPAYRELAADLAAVRAGIDRIDHEVVRLLAERARLVQDATRFKADAFQVAAPARQAAVFAGVRALAARQPDVFDGFPDIVEATYRTLVAAFIAREQQFFEQTEAIGQPAPARDEVRS